MLFFDNINIYTILISYSVHDILYFKMNFYLYFMISLYNVHYILYFPFKSLLAYLEKILINKI